MVKRRETASKVTMIFFKTVTLNCLWSSKLYAINQVKLYMYTWRLDPLLKKPFYRFANLFRLAQQTTIVITIWYIDLWSSDKYILVGCN